MKRIIAALALVLTLALPGMAAAEGTGMYLAPKFLMSIQSTGNTERTDALAGSGVDSYSQFTLGGAFALGYDFWPQQMLPLRAEIEFALRGNNEKTWSDGGQYINEVKGTWNSSTLFANLFWDFSEYGSCAIEYVFGRRNDFNKDYGNASRINTMIQYRF